MSNDSSSRLSKDVVLLIHGTGAAQELEEGSAWWQRDSRFWNSFHQRLAACDAGLADRAFHWSGLNTATDRSLAAADLLKNWLLPWEEARQPYHLVGHSHG